MFVQLSAFVHINKYAVMYRHRMQGDRMDNESTNISLSVLKVCAISYKINVMQFVRFDLFLIGLRSQAAGGLIKVF